MAVVYRADDLRHDRPVALKLLRPELAATLGPERFLREIRFAARLQHPNILPLLDSGEVPAEPGVAPAVLWYAMPLVEGERLLDRADSVYFASDVASDWPMTNLVTARLREATGDLPGARRAIGRIVVSNPTSPTFGAVYLREQARLALQAGDTTSAIRALRRYIALRGDAEAGRRPELDRARVQLAALVGR